MSLVIPPEPHHGMMHLCTNAMYSAVRPVLIGSLAGFMVEASVDILRHRLLEICHIPGGVYLGVLTGAGLAVAHKIVDRKEFLNHENVVIIGTFALKLLRS